MSPSGRSGLGALRRLRLRDVLLWTLPPFLAALYLLGASINDYRRLSQLDDWWSNTARVDRFAWWRVRSALNLPRALALDQGLSVEDTQRALLDLRVDRSRFDDMTRDPLAHAGASVEALLFEGNSSRKVDLKLRGDTSVHWTGEKKTLAVRSARNEMFHRSRVNVFSAKEVLPQFAANSMAQDFGLLAPPTAVVPLFLNQRFNGMFRAFAPLDETFLRNAGRIPGNIFRGDTAERGDYFKGLPRELFLNPYIWDRVAANDRPGAIGTAKLFEFIERVHRLGANELPGGRLEAWSIADLLNQHVWHPDEDADSRLFEILDRDEIARLLALNLCVGDPWHTSGVHNHFWYEDSSSGLLHPIPWDLRMLDLANPPPGSTFNRFWRAALRDPRVFAAALEQIWQRNQDGKLLATVSARVQDSWDRYRDGFEFDRLRSGPICDVGTPEQVLGTLGNNLKLLDGWCRDARASVAVTQIAEDESIIDIWVDGHAPLEVHGLELGDGREARLTADTYLDGKRFIGDRSIALVREDALLRVAPTSRQVLQPGVRAAQRLESEGINYRYYLKSAGPPPAVGAIVLHNAITGERVLAAPLASNAELPAGTSVHPWSLREPSSQRIYSFDGDQTLSKSLEIKRGDTLRIGPGANLVLDPNVSLLCRGRVEALGTAEQPITISSSDPLRPWGSLALMGAGADGSVFKHVRFSHGGGALLDDVEYTGMVCVHWARGVRFEDCEFSENLRCDDALHADEAEITVLRSWFHDTNADALDLDISQARIEGCKIERAGNDGFDLMTCSPELIGNEIVGNKDKGISVGEESDPFIFGNTIRDCERGIEIKDRSAPLILHNTLTQNHVGIMARLKNWRYERGGWPRIVRTSVASNQTELQLQPSARSTQFESRFGGTYDVPPPDLDADLSWLYALHGIAIDAPSIGAAQSWREIPRAVLVAEERFPDGWNAPEATWQPSGGVTSLRVAEDCLVVRTNAQSGEMTREVAWKLGDATRKYWLVLEASATDIASAQVRVGGPGDAGGETALQFGAGPQQFAWTILALPTGDFDSLTLALQPASNRGQLRLNHWSVVSADRDSLGTTR